LASVTDRPIGPPVLRERGTAGNRKRFDAARPSQIGDGGSPASSGALT
jgi:hypothetical protein